MYWYDLKKYDAEAFADAKMQTHYAMQWLARTLRMCEGEGADNAKLAGLAWDTTHEALVSEMLPGGLSFGLQIETLTLIAFNNQVIAERFPLDGIDESSVGEWLAVHLEAFGFDPGMLSTGADYSIPYHRLADGAVYDVIGGGLAFSELAHWLSNGYAVLADLRKRFMRTEPLPSPLLCCPNRFKLLVSISLRRGNAAMSEHRTIRAGLSPGDANHAEPYYFVILSQSPKQIQLPEFVDIGRWHVNGFVGAIAAASEIIGEDLQERYVRQFLDQAISVGCSRRWA